MAINPEPTEYGGQKPLADLARESAWALRDTAQWLHRRVERICHTERLMVRRRVSVDFTIPRGLPPFDDDGDTRTPSTYFVPVALLRKWPPLIDFDLHDETGRSIPLLTSERNRDVDAAALVGLAPVGPNTESLRPLLEQIPREDARGARKALEGIGTFMAPRFDDLLPDEQRKWAQALGVAGTLVANSILWVRVEAFPCQRQIVKFAFTDIPPHELSTSRRFLTAFSWAPLRAQYELPNLGERGSYHLEIEAPPDLAIYSAKLELSALPPRGRRPNRVPFAFVRALPSKLVLGARSRLGEFVGVPPNRDGRGPLREYQCEVGPGQPYKWNVRERAYFYVMGSRHQYGVASVDLGVGHRALIASALRASLVITALLGFLWHAPGTVVNHVAGAVSLLVIFPALLALLVIRAGEHPLMRQLIAGVRFLLVGAALLPVVDALIMLRLVHPHPSEVRTPFLVVFLIGTALSILLSASWLLPPVEDER